MKIYTNPGKARKQCQCGVYCHARCANCPKCNFIFNKEVYERKQNVTEIKSSDTGGQGRKECKTCNKFFGVRTKFCPLCGKDFKPVEKQVREVYQEFPKYAEQLGMFGTKVIIIPSGQYIKPKSSSKEDILDWINIAVFKGDSIIAPTGLKYMLRSFFQEEELNKTTGYVDLWYKELKNGTI